MGSKIPKIKSKQSRFFPKQFTVGVLNATSDLAALVLVGVAAFWALTWSWLPLAPFMGGVRVLFCGLSSGLGLPLAPFLWC